MGELIRLPLPDVDLKQMSKPGRKPKAEYKTEMTDEELYELLCQYANWYHLKFKHEWKLRGEKEDIFGELAVKAMEVKGKYDPKKSSLRSFYITAFRRRMENYRQYLYIRQVKYPMAVLGAC